MSAPLPAPSVNFAALLAMPGAPKTVARNDGRAQAAQLLGQDKALPIQAPLGGGMASMLACRASLSKPKKRRGS